MFCSETLGDITVDSDVKNTCLDPIFNSRMSRIVSLKRKAAFRDEQNQIRECYVSFSLQIDQGPSRTAVSDDDKLPVPDSLATSEEKNSLHDLLKRSTRNSNSRCYAFKRRVCFYDSDSRLRKRTCTVNFVLKDSGAGISLKKRNLEARMIGDFKMFAPKSFICDGNRFC